MKSLSRGGGFRFHEDLFNIRIMGVLFFFEAAFFSGVTTQKGGGGGPRPTRTDRVTA